MKRNAFQTRDDSFVLWYLGIFCCHSCEHRDSGSHHQALEGWARKCCSYLFRPCPLSGTVTWVPSYLQGRQGITVSPEKGRICYCSGGCPGILPPTQGSTLSLPSISPSLSYTSPAHTFTSHHFKILSPWFSDSQLAFHSSTSSKAKKKPPASLTFDRTREALTSETFSLMMYMRNRSFTYAQSRWTL